VEDPTKEISMSVKQIDPLQTNDLLQKDKTAAYVDVRTVQEFQAGHVPGAANIPVMIPDPSSGRMTPNPNFVQAIEAAFPKERKLILGCQAGGRSQYAADLLDKNGYSDVSNMQGGFGGAKDPMGRVVTPGWLQCNLPVEM
jgi:rhodanese-related sulfurtransferase